VAIAPQELHSGAFEEEQGATRLSGPIRSLSLSEFLIPLGQLHLGELPRIHLRFLVLPLLVQVRHFEVLKAASRNGSAVDYDDFCDSAGRSVFRIWR